MYCRMVEAAVRNVVALAFGLLGVHVHNYVSKHRVKTKDSEDKKNSHTKTEIANQQYAFHNTSDMKHKYVLFTTAGCQCGWYRICSTAL